MYLDICIWNKCEFPLKTNFFFTLYIFLKSKNEIYNFYTIQIIFEISKFQIKMHLYYNDQFQN